MKKNKKSLAAEIRDYDSTDTSNSINSKKRLAFKDIDLKLPDSPPTQVVSIRLPSELLNDLRAIGSQSDIGYQSLVKMFLSDAVEELKAKRKKRAA